MTATIQAFSEITAEHHALERRYEALEALCRGGHVPLPELRRSLDELLLDLRHHFQHEEENGYFVQIVEMAPRLSHQAVMLEDEHVNLLNRLSDLRQRADAEGITSGRKTAMLQELGDFIDACRRHEHHETELVQEAWLTEVGVGD